LVGSSTYNSVGEETSVVSNSGSTTYSYDATGQLIQAVLPGGRTLTYQYDAVGNRIEVSDSAASTVSYTTNDLDEYVTVGATTYTYRSFAATKGLALRELRLAA
jgi:YD repeat-containing protein